MSAQDDAVEGAARQVDRLADGSRCEVFFGGWPTAARVHEGWFMAALRAARGGPDPCQSVTWFVQVQPGVWLPELTWDDVFEPEGEARHG